MYTFPRCCLVEQFHSFFGLYVTRSDVPVVREYLTLVASLHWHAHIHLIWTHMPKPQEDMKFNIFYLIIHCGRHYITMQSSLYSDSWACASLLVLKSWAITAGRNTISFYEVFKLLIIENLIYIYSEMWSYPPLQISLSPSKSPSQIIVHSFINTWIYPTLFLYYIKIHKV